MALPKQVQAQLAEVEELEKTLTAQPKAKEKKAAKPEEPEAELDTDAEVPSEAEQAPANVDVKPADTSPTDVEDETFAQKYKTLQGKYDAEVPRLHQQIRDLTSKLKALEEASFEKPSEPTKSKEKVSYVTDEDRAEFGEELIDVQRRVAKEVAQEYEDRFEQQEAIIAELQKQLKQTGSEVGQMNFSQRLVQLVPDFEKIDNDPRWVAWLNEVDPIIRDQRRVLAQAAFDKGDAEAVAHYVKLFKQTIAEPEADIQVKAVRQTELEKQVAPSRSASSASTPTDRKAKVYSQAEIDSGWNKIRMLMKKGSMAEAEKLEAEITAAYLEGRVR
jgi:uncharacterized coiled-coil protein SlyX